MSESSPSDLAVAFRGFGRRLREAFAAAEDDHGRLRAAQPHADQLLVIVRQAGALVGGGFADTVDQLGAGVAERIDAIAPDDWDESVLTKLRTLALAAGKELRAAERAAEG